jgi:monofunctional biosynthetic peptidoglycan transglycosylase
MDLKRVQLITKKTVSLTVKLVLLLATLVSLFALYVLSLFPSEKEIKGCMTTVMFSVKLCPSGASYVRLNSISSHLKKAVVLTEDSAFYQHNGFDFQELENSIRTNLEKGRFARGGSTISQQLAKNMFLSKEKTLSRKFKEALITLQIEKYLSKNEILERYLNVVQFGKGIFGVKEAAWYYFKKSPGQLDVVESAYLAFLLPSPEVYSKSFYRKNLTPFAQRRLNQIVERMYQYNRIDENEYLDAKEKLNYFLTGAEPPPKEDVESLDEELAEEQLFNEL